MNVFVAGCVIGGVAGALVGAGLAVVHYSARLWQAWQYNHQMSDWYRRDLAQYRAELDALYAGQFDDGMSDPPEPGDGLDVWRSFAEGLDL